MMPDLGKYADTVLAAYAVSIGLLLAIVIWSLWKGARVKRALEAQETRMGRRNG
ncbi:MAG: heme exporter protein CcmD [Paracoccaceae bacterium]|jgi:heme exporter protein D